MALLVSTSSSEDAKYFSDKCGSRPLRFVSDGESYEPALFSSGRSNIDDFAYRSSRQSGVRNENLVPTWAIDELPRFHFFGTWSGQIYKGVVPLLSDPAPTMSTRLKEGLPKAAEVSLPPHDNADIVEAKAA